MNCKVVLAHAICLLACGIVAPIHAEDWPMWRYDSGHTGASPQKMPGALSLQWTLELPPLERAWPDEDRLEFDVAYEPIAAANTLFLSSAHSDAIMAFDAESGSEKWRFYTDGPVRFAPAVDGGLLYAGSDDGFLYCLDAASGMLQWRFKAALSDRKVLGNTRMISVWPVRGAPVVADGTVYFAAGIWPFEGVCVYALDAKTGVVRWMKDNYDVRYMLQPHHSPAFSGMAPQGYLAVSGDKLLVPNGRAPAACLDRNTGQLLFYELDPNNRYGDYRVSVRNDFYVNPGALYQLEAGQNLGSFPSVAVMGATAIICADSANLRAFDYTKFEIKTHRDKRQRVRSQWEASEEWSVAAQANNIILAGGRLYGCRPGGLFMVDVPKRKSEPKLAWETEVEGNPVRIIAANERLYASTVEGRIYCIGKKQHSARIVAEAGRQSPPADDNALSQARDILRASGVSEGYALILGVEGSELSAALAQESRLHIVGIGAAHEILSAARRTLDETGLYGKRVALFEADPLRLPLPPYFASLAVLANASSDFPHSKERVEYVYECLRPFGGVACFQASQVTMSVLEKTVQDAGLAGAKLERKDSLILLRRTGPLPGSANWTHQYADASNSLVSQETRVRTPLGLLWFGGSSNKDILPRHGHGPSEQVVDGRLFIEGPDMIRALDVYTGRVLWQTALPDIGKAYDNTHHQPGANALGSNYVSLADGVYVAYGAKCLRLDPATGTILSEFTLPAPEGTADTPDFGYIAVWEDTLVAGSGPLRYDEEIKGQTWNAVASKRIVALNRHTGAPLWSRTADAAFRHNAIVLGGGKVFCIDRATDELRDQLARRGVELPESGCLLALDVQTGQEQWRVTKDVFGTWLGYSQQHGLLLQAGRASGDMLKDEAKDRMAVYNGADGAVLWDRKMGYSGPCMLHNATIIAQQKFFSLSTGDPSMRQDPLTGTCLDMSWMRQHGCNTAIACQNLVTFRSAAAGFFDLQNDGGTGNLGGFRSGCTSNLIAANGVLNAPDYTRTCTCSYQIQTSLALIHRPEVEMWTFNAFEAASGRINRLGLNLGAPGDRRDKHATLWLDYPSVGGPSPEIKIVTEPAEPLCYRYHSSRMTGGGLTWVAASGMKGLQRLNITLEEGAKDSVPYTVRLFFAEPGEAEPGQRIFDVSLQGRAVLKDFDPAAEAGGAMRVVEKEFTDVAIRDALEITLNPKSGADTLLCGVEMVAKE
ncbi:MAG TPA: PQQ-binding-like beta-propeller repeat protein [Candidatus Hydrogenedentes bacterium]|nr:PQQ-binding-like beta-propeller repeat protein [Candidatus Hydrogenedentota bacterium]